MLSTSYFINISLISVNMEMFFGFYVHTQIVTKLMPLVWRVGI